MKTYKQIGSYTLAVDEPDKLADIVADTIASFIIGGYQDEKVKLYCIDHRNNTFKLTLAGVDFGTSVPSSIKSPQHFKEVTIKALKTYFAWNAPYIHLLDNTNDKYGDQIDNVEINDPRITQGLFASIMFNVEEYVDEDKEALIAHVDDLAEDNKVLRHTVKHLKEDLDALKASTEDVTSTTTTTDTTVVPEATTTTTSIEEPVAEDTETTMTTQEHVSEDETTTTSTAAEPIGDEETTTTTTEPNVGVTNE